jgi:hypothetical protein
MASFKDEVPDELPEHLVTADDLWRDMERDLPADTPEDLRRTLEQDCRALFERAFDVKRLETEVSVSGEWGPEFVGAFVKRAVEVGTRQVFNTMLGEIVQLRVELTTLSRRVRLLEDGK